MVYTIIVHVQHTFSTRCTPYSNNRPPDSLARSGRFSSGTYGSICSLGLAHFTPALPSFFLMAATFLSAARAAFSIFQKEQVYGFIVLNLCERGNLRCKILLKLYKLKSKIEYKPTVVAC